MEKKYRNQYATDEMFTAANGMEFRAEEVFKGIQDNCRVYAAKNGRDFEGGDMEDIFQDCALKFWGSRGSYNPSKGASLRTYGARIARNRECDAYHKEMSRLSRFSSIEDFSERGYQWESDCTVNCRSDEFDADFDIRRSEASEYIREKIEGLNDDYRTVITLLTEGYCPDEIAERFGWDMNRTYRTCCRARKALARALGRDFLAENGFSRI